MTRFERMMTEMERDALVAAAMNVESDAEAADAWARASEASLALNDRIGAYLMVQFSAAAAGRTQPDAAYVEAVAKGLAAGTLVSEYKGKK